MNIVYSSSDTYAELCGISLISFLINNKDSKNIRVFIIDNDISDTNKENLRSIADEYKCELVFIPKPDPEKIIHSKIYTGRWNIGTFFRLYLASILPSDVDRVIYLDCDMIIRKSLKDVYELDIGNCLVAGVDDCRSDLYRIDIGEQPGQLYINNGFMLLDLKKWREQNIEEKVNEFIADRQGDCTYMDQAPLNGILGKDNLVYELEAKYNAQRIFFDFTYKQLLRLRKPKRHLSEEEYNEAVNDPVIVHFTPVFITGTRPWQVKDKHKFTPEYLHYKSLSPWKDVPLRKDDRKLPKKIMTVICKITPKCIMIPIMSYLHAKWYPKKRIKIYQKMKGKQK